jgi:3-oxoacyl-[acyl-carrier-protein] synthase-3
MVRNARIRATGMYVPSRVVPNSWFDERLGENVSDWLEEHLAIRERRWAADDESTADLVEAAARRILEDAGVEAGDVDLIIVATDTPEYVSPSTAVVVQDRIGATRAGTFDLNTACAGFVTALDTGSKFIQADPRYRHVLVIGAYAMSKYLDLDDKKTVTLFADGAAGVLLEAHEGSGGGLASRPRSAGQYEGWMGIYAGGTHLPASPEVLARGDHKLRFVKKFPPEINPDTWSEMIREVLADTGRSPEDVACFFFTQININSIRETMKRLELPMARAHTVMDRYAYTGSACIPMALDDAVRAGRLERGDLIVFMGSGGGLAFACAAFEW